MDWLLTLYLGSLVLSAVLPLVLAVVILWARRRVSGAVSVIVILLVMAVLAGGNAYQVTHPGSSYHLTIFLLMFLALAVLPTAWLIFVLQFTGSERWLEGWLPRLLLIEPVVVALLALTNVRHNWLWTGVYLDESSPLPLVRLSVAGGYWAHAVYSYALVIAGVWLLLLAVHHNTSAIRWQSLILLLCVSLPFIAHAAHAFGWGPYPNLNLTPLAFMLASLILVWTLRRFWLYDIVPVARSTVIEGMKAGIVVVDLRGRIADANPAACQFLEKTLEQVQGAPVRRVFPLLDALLETECREARGALPAEINTEITVGENGDLRYFELEISPLCDRHGVLTGRLVLWNDNTERRRAEEMLREREARLQLVVSQLPAVLWTTDAQLRYTSMLGAGLVDLKVQPNQLVGKSVIQNAVHGEATTASIIAHRRALDGFPSPYQEVWSSRAYQCYVEPLRSGAGEIIGTVGMGIDVTNRQMVERALVDSEERYRQSVEQSPNPIFATDRSGRILSWNKACEKLFQRGQEIIGEPYHALLFEPEQAGHIDHLIERVYSEKTHLADIDLAYRTQEGAVRYTVSRLYPVIRQGGQVEACVFANTDITERIKGERALRRQLEELSMLNAVAAACVEAASETELITRVTDVIARALYMDNLGVLLVDEANHCLRFHPSYHGLSEQLKSLPVDLKKGVAGQVALSGIPARVSGTSFSDGHAHIYFQTRSELCVPVKIGGRVIAVLNAESRQVEAFSESDESLLDTIAGQIATAIERLQAEAAERRRVTELLAITRVSSEITSVLDRQELFNSIVRHAAELSNSDASGLFLIRPDSRFYLVSAFGVGEAFMARINREGVPKEGTAVGRAFGEAKPVQIENIPADALYSAGDLAEMEGILSILALPLLLGSEPIGGIVLWRRQVYKFSQEEIVFIQALAQQSVNALENARLFDAERSQRKLAEFMREVATTLAASLDLDTVLDHLLDQISRVVHYSLGNILVCEQKEAYSARYKGEPQYAGLLEEVLPHLRLPLNAPLLEAMAGTGQPLIIPDLAESPYPEVKLNHPDLRAWIGAPVVVSGRVAAIFSLYASAPGFYHEEHAARLATLAGQAALALQNAHLFDETRRRAAQQEALNAIIAAGVMSTDLQSLLNEVLDHTLHALGMEKGGLWVDGLTALRGLPDGIGQASRSITRTSESRVEQTLIVEDWRLLPENPFYAHMRQFNLLSSLTVPVLSGKRRMGGMSLVSEHPHHWRQEDVALVEAVGRQVGSAVERLNLLAKTQEQACQVQQIMDTVPDGVILLDAERRIVLTNPAAAGYLAVLAPERLESAPLDYLGAAAVDQLLQAAPDQPWLEMPTALPAPRIFEAAARPIESVGQPEGWVLVLRDVTRERESQERIQMHERLATVGQLAAGIAHDFNNIMAAIVVYADLLIMDPTLTPSSRDRLGIIQQQVQRATSLIRQILDFSRRSVMEQSEMDLLPFIKELDKLLERVLPENIRLDLTYQPGSYAVEADPTRLQQAFMNLALNARDAMPNGGSLSFFLSRVCLHPEDTRPYPDLTPGDWIKVEVRDNGAGIEPEVLPHIFDPFFTTKPVGQGTGLGLAQVYGIVKGHRGSIGVRSQVGKGTVFTLYFPALDVPAQAYLPLEDEALFQGTGETVLLAEDDQAAREALEALLRSQNFEVIAAANGVEALRLYRAAQAEIALVVTDIVMPEMGGMALYQALQEDCPQVRVLFVTGHPLDEQNQALLERGSIHWLQKPFTIKAFMRALQAVLSGTPAQGGAGQTL